MTLEDFFAHGRCEVDNVRGCILWGRAKSGPDGYGTAWDRGAKKTVPAHRLAWRLANGQDVPKGMVVMHSCDVKSCVNPDHLNVGTQSQNILDAVARGLASPGAYNLLKRACPSNHPYTEDNIYYRGNGTRMCKTCHKNRNRKVAS